MKKIALAAVKRQLESAASDLRMEGDSVSLTNLAKAIHMPRPRLYELIAFVRPQWRAELQVVDGRRDDWNRKLIYDLYENVTGLLRKEDRLPTANNLAEMLKVTPGAIWDYMNRHPDLATRIGFCSQLESDVFHAGRRIRFSGEPVTRQAIARKTGFDRSSIRSVLKKRPEFLSLLALKEPPVKKIVTRRNGRPPKPRWLKNTRRLQKTAYPKNMPLQDRIIAAACERRGVEVSDVIEKKGGGNGHNVGYARDLAMYLLTEDTELAPGEIGRLFGDRNAEHVRRGRAMILKDIHRPRAKQEIEILRKKYFR